MNCPKCGQPINPGAAFCGNCGQPLSQPAPMQTQPQIVQPQVSSPPSPTVVSPEVLQPQPISPAAQVYANQPNVPTAVVNNFSPPVNVGAGNVGTMPAYGVAVNSDEHAGEVMAIIGLILGVIGIPASIIPLLGLVLGITGLALSTVARSKHKRVLTIFGIVFSSIAIVAALGLWVYVIVHDPKLHKDNSSLAGTSSASLVAISTPCYTVKIDSGLQNYKPTGCAFDAASTTEEFTVEGQSNPGVNSSNLAQIGQQSLASAASGINATVTAEQSGQFAGSPAYIANLTGNGTNAGKNMIAALVLHSTANGDNIFMVIHVVSGTQQASFGSLESTWQWE
jgi:hypothetical protein